MKQRFYNVEGQKDGEGGFDKKLKCLKMKVKFSNVTGGGCFPAPVKCVFFSFLSWNKETCSNH